MQIVGEIRGEVGNMIGEEVGGNGRRGSTGSEEKVGER